MGVTYIELKKDDAVDLMGLRLSVLRTDPYSFSVTEEEEKRASKNNIESVIESYRLSTDRKMLGARNGSLVGVVGVERYENEIEKHKVRLWGPYVDSSSRGKGIGDQLIEKALEFAFSVSGIEIVTLETISESKGAISLFIKHGFEKTGVQNQALCYGEKYADLIYMQKNKST